MVWQGFQIGLTALTILVNLPAARPEKGMDTPELSFLPSRTDGGALLGTPFTLPPKFDSSTEPLAQAQSRKRPTPPAKPPATVPLTGPAINLGRLWNLAQLHRPELQQSSGLALSDKRHEVQTRLRRGYFEYLCLLQEANEVKLTMASLGDKVRARPPGSAIVRVSAKVEALGLEVLLEEVKAQLRKTQADLDATWGRLLVEAGVPDLPRPSSISDRPQVPPQWTLPEIEKSVLRTEGMNRALLEAESIRSPGMMERTEREVEAAYAAAVANACILELKLLGQTREAWSRYRLAWDNLKRLNEETLPRLNSRIDLVTKAYEAGREKFGIGDVCQMERDRFNARLRQCRTRRDLWLAVADLQGLMQMGIE